MGEKRAALLTRLDADVVAVPRMLETLHRVPDKQLNTIRTASDIYWRAMEESLRKDIELQNDAQKFDTALFLFALLAFESLKRGKLNGVPPGKPTREFLDHVWVDRETQIRKYYSRKNFAGFDNELIALGKLSSMLIHSILNSSDVIHQVKFRDPTIRDFLAAIWISKFANEADIQWLRENRYCRHIKSSKPYHAMWRFAAEMPYSDSARDTETWSNSMAVLFEPSEHRPAEIIWRAWPTMLRLAGFPVPENCFEVDLVEPSTQAFEFARSFVINENGNPVFSKQEVLVEAIELESNPAKRALLNFLTPFPAMLCGLNGVDTKKLVKSYDERFIEITDKIEEIRDPATDELLDVRFMPTKGRTPEKLVCVGRGEDSEGNPNLVEIESPFWLAQFTLTNQLYALYASGERDNKIDDPVKRANCPATRINWFEASVAAIFFHAGLPTEDQWEYAARARPGSNLAPWEYCFGSDTNRLSEFACFGKPLVSHSEPVGQRRSWAQLFDMHGNVWEWTSSWYSSDRKESRNHEFVGRSRVVRGGADDGPASICASAIRSIRRPSILSQSVGVRFSRAQ